MNRWWRLLAVVLLGDAGLAVAQTPEPTVAPFPLELRRMAPGVTNKEREELQAEFRRLVRSAGATVPNASAMDAALGALRRQDCDRENECLQQLALKAQTLYAMFASLDYDLAKNVVVTGRVVRDDGKLEGELRTISLAKGKDSFAAVARVALVQLLAALHVRELPPFREVVVAPPPVAPPPVVAPAPPSVLEPVAPGVVAAAPAKGSRGARTAGFVLVGTGVASAVAGGILFGVGRGSAGLDERNVILDVGTFKSSQTNQAVGVALLAGGAAVAIAGSVLLMLNPKESVVVTPSVSPTGVGVSVGGKF